MPDSRNSHTCTEVVFKRLFFEYARTLRNYLYFRCGDAALADDLVQEAYLTLWRNGKQVHPDKAKGYLLTVATRGMIDAMRKRETEKRYRLKQVKTLPTDKDGQFKLEEKEFKLRLEKALAELPESQRMVFLLNRLENMSYRKMADFLGIHLKTIEKRMHLALKNLRQVFQDQPAGPW